VGFVNAGSEETCEYHPHNSSRVLSEANEAESMSDESSVCLVWSSFMEYFFLMCFGMTMVVSILMIDKTTPELNLRVTLLSSQMR